MVTDDGVQLYVEVDGPEDAAVTIVLVHGFAVNMAEYVRQRDMLRTDVRLVLFDQRGHGRSGWGSFRAATLPRLARDLEIVVNEYGGSGPVVLVGHSLGSMAVMALAQSRPQLFGDKVVATALISASAGGVVPGATRPVVGMLAGTFLLRLIGWLLWLLAPLMYRLGVFRTRSGRSVLRHYLFGSEPPTEGDLSLIQRMCTATPRDMAAALYPGMLSHDTIDAAAALARIPCLVLTGVDDRTIAPGHSERIAAKIGASARLVRVPGAGHMVNLTHWRQVDDALRELLAVACNEVGGHK